MEDKKFVINFLPDEFLLKRSWRGCIPFEIFIYWRLSKLIVLRRPASGVIVFFALDYFIFSFEDFLIFTSLIIFSK